jgi:hypothetical protein
MRVPHSVRKAIEWIERAELPDGGMRATDQPGDERPYPEVSGYLIAALLRCNRVALAERLGEWLMRSQNADGSWNGLDSVPAAFDTAIITRGLAQNVNIWEEPNPDWQAACKKGRAYVESCRRKDARIGIRKDCADSPIYMILAAAICNRHNRHVIKLFDYPAGPVRLHYLAYAIEGLKMGRGKGPKLANELIRAVQRMQKPYPFQVHITPEECVPVPSDRGPCICANLQMAMLGVDRELLNWCIDQQADSGGFPVSPGFSVCNSWAAKYFLDAVAACYPEMV